MPNMCRADTIDMASILSDKEKFIELASKATCMREMLELAGLRAAGGNFQQLNKWSEVHNVPIPRGMSDTTKAVAASTRWTVDNVFVENCSASRHIVKRIIIKNNVIPYVCATPGCGLQYEWLGKPIVLQLEHRNGIHNDNRVENLAFLCPNCHSQTETYAGKRG